MNEIDAEILIVLPLTTSELQPLDVGFFRHYKLLFYRLLEKAPLFDLHQEITSRLGVISLHSLLWDQFRAPLYNDAIRYALYSTDPLYDDEETRVIPAAVLEISLG